MIPPFGFVDKENSTPTVSELASHTAANDMFQHQVVRRFVEFMHCGFFLFLKPVDVFNNNWVRREKNVQLRAVGLIHVSSIRTLYLMELYAALNLC
jgi:hypothetical protein